MTHTKNIIQKKIFISSFFITALILFFWIYHYGPIWPANDSYGFLRYINFISNGDSGLIDVIRARSNEHLIAFHLAVALATLQATGIWMKALIYENAILLLSSGIMLWFALRQSTIIKIYPFLTTMAVTLPLLNPSQTSYLLWSFQIWWYLDLAMLAGSFLLIERYGFRAYPAIFIICLLATGSEAQGGALWLSSGAHFFMISLRSREIRKGLFIGLLHAILFVVAVWLTLLVSSTNIPKPEKAIGLLGHLIYFTKMIGGGFGNQNELFALITGAISLILWALLFIRSLSFNTVEKRLGAVLTVIPLLWTAEFSVGRENLGVSWAFSDFHEAPMLVPFFIGISIYALDSLPRKFASAVATAFITIPLMTGASWGYARSVEMRAISNLAAAANCSGIAVPRKDMLRLILLDNYGSIYDETANFVPQMCHHAGDVSKWIPDLQAYLNHR
ncbi:Hypothetical protein GbCGDNIH9_0337 [Granulibacter bethesdensis]|uniref:Uncharacterized protein n=1 Tax=Granulibacter bethesdensis TaxID=364410 RepID=A0AAC9K654_9PROT|nr:hypothetical protein [Granulibacter bethesdensis]APH53566.1 Hypothetical protein GbCGDNIH9_0337 [Granulibacter bethesdensis]APH61144.1 Hypothetical protein GbCGDNIH8_0337 [Granulibacter bethesdensis]